MYVDCNWIAYSIISFSEEEKWDIDFEDYPGYIQSKLIKCDL